MRRPTHFKGTTLFLSAPYVSVVFVFAPAGAHRESSVNEEASIWKSTILPPSAPYVSAVHIGDFLVGLRTVSVCHQTRDNFLTGVQIEVATDSGNELPRPEPLSAPNASVS